MNFMKKAKLNSMLLIASIGVLTSASCFVLNAFAQSSLDNRQGIVFTEDALSEGIVMSEIVDRDNENLSVTSTTIKLPEKMSSEEAAPFIQKATEALYEKNIYLSAEDYIVDGSYDSESNSVTIDYLPADWKELGPMKSVSGTAYFVSFKNVDISAGTGTLAGVQMIDGIDISIDYGNTYTIKLKKLQ